MAAAPKSDSAPAPSTAPERKDSGRSLRGRARFNPRIAAFTICLVLAILGGIAGLVLARPAPFVVAMILLIAGAAPMLLWEMQRQPLQRIPASKAEAESALRRVFEVSLDAISVNRLTDGMFLEANPEFERITGYSERELLGHTVGELGLWTTVDDHRDYLRRLDSERSVRNAEITFRRRDGSRVPGLMSSVVVDLNNELCVVSVVRDVSDWKRTEEELREAHRALSAQVEALRENRRSLHESETLIRKVFEASLDTIAIQRLSDRAFIDVNPAFERHTGISREQALSKGLDEHQLWVDPVRREEFFRLLREQGFVRDWEEDFRVRDGQIEPHLVSAVVVEMHGVPHFIMAVRDIARFKRNERALIAAHEEMSAQVEALRANQQRLTTEIVERALAEKRLRESEAKLRKVFDASLDAVSIRRIRDDRLLDVNRELVRAFGYSREELLSRPMSELHLWNDSARRAAFYREVRAHGQVRNFESEYRTKDGQIVPCVVSGVILELDGEPCIVVVTRDNRPFKQAESELIAVREALTSQVQALRESQRQLQTEIVRHQEVIAQREQAERRARRSEATLRQIFDTSLDALTVSRMRDGALIDFNQEFLHLTGFSREQVIGKTLKELGLRGEHHRTRELVETLQTRGFIRNWTDNYRIGEGDWMPMLVSAAIVDIDGEACAVVDARDIREIRKTERELIEAREALSAQVEALRESQIRLQNEVAERERVMAQRQAAQQMVRESEAKLRKIFDTSIDAISIRRLRDDRYIDVNPEFLRLTGYSRGEVIGRTLDDLDLRADELKPVFVAALQANGYVRNMEGKLRRRDRSIVPIMTSGVLLELGGEQCIVAITRDVTQAKRAEAELIAAREAALKASQAKSDFLSSMSHEIRTPMNAILGMEQLLWETPLSLDQRRYLETMRANGDALLSLIDNILDLARVESGQLILERVSFELDELVERAVETLCIRAHEKGLELVARIAPDVPLGLEGDPLRLRQIVINLLGNAIKFTNRGEVLLNVECVPAPPGGRTPPQAVWLRFAVSDTGIGIPAEKLTTVFSSFTQADSSITRQFGGTGLGLAIVKRLVEFHGGEVQVKSQPGVGSTFSFTLPVFVSPVQAAKESSSKTNFSGRRVLVVDDTEMNRRVTWEILTPCGATVDQAADAHTALDMIDRARARATPYDLVLLDSRIPGSSSFEVVTRMKSIAPHGAGGPFSSTGQTPERVVLMLASDDLASSLQAMRELGLTTYIVKPIRRRDLLEATSAAVGPIGPSLAVKTVPAFGAPAAGPTAPVRILLAEDSSDNRMLIAAYLKGGDYQIDEAENGEMAINMFKAAKYDVVLMDIQMPIVDGYTAVRGIRQWEAEQKRARTPIIALTASAMNEAVQRSLQVGCDSHVSKPVKRATLIEAVRQATAGLRDATPAIREIASNGSNGIERPGASDRIIVRVDADLRDLIPDYLVHKRTDSIALSVAVEQGDFTIIGALGHRMKGDGTSYGFDQITEIGAGLMDAVRREDLVKARRLAASFADYLARVEVVFKPEDTNA
jgi:PAS domain S-box-containing protein